MSQYKLGYCGFILITDVKSATIQFTIKRLFLVTCLIPQNTNATDGVGKLVQKCTMPIRIISQFHHGKQSKIAFTPLRNWDWPLGLWKREWSFR